MTPHSGLPNGEPISLLSPGGERLAWEGFPAPSDRELLDLLGPLINARRYNDQSSALVRQGKLAVYPSSHGQEACQVAAARVLRDGDWLFPTYRDTAAVVSRGLDPVQVLTLLRGDWHNGYDPSQTHVAPLTTPLATQLVHAVGVGCAARMRSEPTVVMAMCGDGATSEGDFHEALNLAAVFGSPVVFFIQNNQYAISVPMSRQSVAPSLAHKGVGYGIPAERVDGNDVAALMAVLGQAVANARAGQGPQLVEAHTYRMQAHTNADDASRYRSDDEVAAWSGRDPILRVEHALRQSGSLDDDGLAALWSAADQMASNLRDGVNAQVEPDAEELFSHVYSQPTSQLREQAAILADELARDGANW